MNKEDQLLEAARKLDPDALRTIFDSYSSHIFNFSLRLCQNSVEADNIVGDVFALLIDRLAQGQGPTSNLRSYLFQIAYHCIVDKSRARKHTAPLETAEFSSHEEISLSQQAEDDLMLATVIQAMKTELTPDQYQVLVLRFVEGFNVHETADITGKNVNNVKVIQSRAIEKLRQVLK